MTEQVDQKQRVLKGIVIILGILIVVCLAIIVVTIVNRTFNSAGDGGQGTAVMEQMIVPSPGPDFGEISLTMPPGSRVISTDVTPYEIHALMLTPFGQRLVVIDRATGEILGTVRFTPDQRQQLQQQPEQAP